MTLDLFSTGAAPAGTPGPQRERALSVSQVNALVRQLLEGSVPPLWVAGEVTGWKRHASGHCYFTLRDAAAQLRCVMFRADAQRLPTDPEEGMRVRALGGLTLYERRGEYQLVARRLEAEGGDGLWRLAFERLRARLQTEGLLAPERKRPLPRTPAAVGIVTSSVGAVLHDILHVIERRAPWTRVILAPARVQGDGAALEIATALHRLSHSGLVDVVIVGRGGGAMEDLWPFNEELVARAIVASPVPVVSAVGHETDVTIADLVADHRSPTPSAAAETVVPDREALARELDACNVRLRQAVWSRVAGPAQRVETLRDALAGRMSQLLRDRGRRLEAVAGRLHALSPLSALARGYALPLADDARLLRRAADFAPGSRFTLRVVDGRVPCRVEATPPRTAPES
jgi:exodeoxyribonuclease VII large subunit